MAVLSTSILTIFWMINTPKSCSSKRPADHLRARAGPSSNLRYRSGFVNAKNKPRALGSADRTQPVIRPCAEMTRTWRLTLNRSRMIFARLSKTSDRFAARLTLREHRGHEKARIDRRDPIAEILQRLRQRKTEILLIEQQLELRSDGLRQLLARPWPSRWSGRGRRGAPGRADPWPRETAPRT